MKHTIMFSSGMDPQDQKVLIGLLALRERVVHERTILVETVDPNVASLLLSLDTAQEIYLGSALPTQSVVEEIDGHLPINDKPKVRKPRKPYNGPLVECSQCHEKKAPFYMTKDGICKICWMREKSRERKFKAQKKSQNPEMSHELGSWSGTKEFGSQESIADSQSKPKEKINLRKLAVRN